MGGHFPDAPNTWAALQENRDLVRITSQKKSIAVRYEQWTSVIQPG